MIRRPTREERPHRAPYVTVTLPVPRESAGPWTFRVPRWSELAPMAQAITDAGGDGARLDLAYGRIIALAWADEEYALETDDVFAELYEAGWAASVLYALANRIQEMAGAEIPREKEVREALRFFGANGAPLALPGSVPLASTVGTSALTTS